jgi:glucosamine--fructose-6-phosphate aminotransferase (isomerizing)
MCGITGAVGGGPVVGLLLEGLGRLEYRGYDSAGVALLEGGGVWRARAATGTKSLVELARLTGQAEHPGRTGIGHTRWATHGRPVEANSHPHLDCTGRLALVHNGIIENYLELGEELIGSGHELASETDTEVLAHMVEAELSRGLGLRDAVAACLGRVSGTFSIAVLHADEPDLIVAARCVSPLIVGREDGRGLVASDIPALLGKASELYALEDGQVAEVRPGSVSVTTLRGDSVEPRPLSVDWDLEEAEKSGFEDFMLKEIHEQPRAVADTLLGRAQLGEQMRLDEVRLSDEELRGVEKVFVVACGSSYHAGMVAKYAIEHWTRLPVEIDIASEFRYRDPVLDDRTLVVGVSQSGETVDTLRAMREAKRWGAKLLVISNVVDSSMAREADAVLYTRAGPEVAVASTKTTLAQVAALEALALYLARLRGILYGEEVAGLLSSLADLPRHIETCLGRAASVRSATARFEGVHDFFLLGRHVGYPVALEGALKLKEIAYVRAEGYPAGELKHGPIALIQPGTVVVAVATGNPLRDKVMSNVAEVRARGATVVLVANDEDTDAAGQADEVFWVPRASHPLFAPLVDLVPLQLFAYHLAKRKGHEVDRPRNLAKTVTVE